MVARDLPPMLAIRAFESAARYEGFSAAAPELHVTAGAVAHQVRQLEKWLGVELFHRRPKGVELTNAGQLYLSRLQPLLEDLEQMSREVRRDQLRTEITVVAMPSFVSRWLMPRLGPFLQAHQQTDVRVVASVPPVHFVRDRVDVAIRPGNENYPSMRKRHLMQDRFVVVASPRYLAESAPLRHPGDLLRHTLLHDEFESLIPDQVDWKRWMRQHGTVELSQAAGAGPMYSHSYLTIEAALRGYGVALQSRVLVQSLIDTGELVIVLPDTETPGPYGLSVFSGISPQPTPRVRDLVAWLVAEAASVEENWAASHPHGVTGRTE